MSSSPLPSSDHQLGSAACDDSSVVDDGDPRRCSRPRRRFGGD